MPDSSLPTITVQKGRTTRVRRGHPWLFSNEVEMTAEAKALPPGGLVTVRDAGGEALGIASFNPHSLIAARLLSRDVGVPVDAAFLAARLEAARRLRDSLFDRPFYRLVHSEADGLPGLVCDRYGDVLAVQCNTAGMEALLPELLAALTDTLAPRAIVLRNDSPVRTLEGLDLYHRVAAGTLDGPVEVEENGVRFLADLTTGQKTGWFFDQRPNRAMAASLARGRDVLDVFCYGGGFGLTAAAKGAARVLLVDRSADALEMAARAAALNGVEDRVSARAGDGFKTMEALAHEDRRFGVVVADPPAFAKSKKDVARAAKGYRKMARLAAGLTAPGGFMVCGSCSHHMAVDRFFEEITRGVAQAGRQGRVIWQHGAGPDHPVHPHLPESAYLKTLIMHLD